MLTGILEPTHLIVILLVALVFLGPKRLPTAGRALGQGLKEFKDSISGDHGLSSVLEPAPATAPPEPQPVSLPMSDIAEPVPDAGRVAA